MDEILLSKTLKLKEELESDPRVVSLNEAEAKMNSSEEVMALAYRKNAALDKYNDLLKYYPDDSEEVKIVRQDLALAKKNLEEHELVRDYLIKYQAVRLLYEEINQTLFGILNNNLCPEER